MIRKSINRFQRWLIPPADMRIRHTPPPLRFGAKGLEFMHQDTIGRLEHLHSLGAYYREQIEAAECECAELMGLDPLADTHESNMARDIVGVGLQVTTVIQEIDQSIREQHADL